MKKTTRPATADGQTTRAASPAARASATKAEPLLEIRNLKTYYPIYGGLLRRRVGSVYAVDGVSLTINRGQTFGLVGESGCGKTTFGRTSHSRCHLQTQVGASRRGDFERAAVATVRGVMG